MSFINKKKEQLIDQDYLKSVLNYSPETGVFTWKADGNNQFMKKGKEAGNRKNQGYTMIMLKGHFYMNHRLAWLYMTGDWPFQYIDHINRIRDDNRWENLREADDSQNRRNSGPAKNNTSGYRGVSYDRTMNKWTASISDGSRKITIGRFKHKEDAARAYNKEAIRIYGDGYSMLNDVAEVLEYYDSFCCA